MLDPVFIFKRKATIKGYRGGYPLANHKSAEKRARQSVKRNARNSQAKASVKTFEKNLVKGIEAKSKEVADLLKSFTAQAMKAADKGQLKKTTVARKISRLSKRVHAALGK
jgi:small subunit ribosomal protein S20